MADTKISAEAAAAALGGTEAIPAVQSTANVKLTPAQLDTYISATTKTLTNKTLTSPAITTPTGIVKGDVGLGNVDNTSNATERAATATLTNKTIAGADNTLTVREADLSIADNTTANASTGAHGFLKKLSNIATEFMNGAGNWAVPAGGGDVTLTGIQTLTNKTLTAPVVNSPTGIVKGDVGLGNVDNTSNVTERAATATLTNKTLTSPVINTPTGIVKGDVGLGNVDNTSNVTERAATATLTNKTIAGANNTLTVREADLATTDVTTGDASTSKHGLLKKLSNVATEFMNGVGAWAVPAGGGGSGSPYSTPQVFEDGSYIEMEISASEPGTPADGFVRLFAQDDGTGKARWMAKFADGIAQQIVNQTGAAIGWQPSDLPGLEAWYDASDIATLTLSGAEVTQWNDKSGNANHVVQGTSANRPTYGATSLGGEPGLTFDNSGNPQFLLKTAFPISSTSMSVIVVGTSAAGNAVTSRLITMFVSGADYNNAAGFIAYRSSAGNIGTYRVSPGSEKALADATPAAIGFIWDATNQTTYVNNVAGTPVGSTGTFGPSDSLFIGSGATTTTVGNDGWLGVISEVIITSNEISSGDRTLLQAYLATKWGI